MVILRKRCSRLSYWSSLDFWNFVANAILFPVCALQYGSRINSISSNGCKYYMHAYIHIISICIIKKIRKQTQTALRLARKNSQKTTTTTIITITVRWNSKRKLYQQHQQTQPMQQQEWHRRSKRRYIESQCVYMFSNMLRHVLANGLW